MPRQVKDMSAFHKLSGAFIWTGIQFLLFILVYDAMYYITDYFRGSARSGVGYGIMVHYTLYLVGLLAAANSVVQTSALSVKAKVYTVLLCVGILGFCLSPNLLGFPNRTSLLMASGIISLLTPLIVCSLSSIGKSKG